MPHVPLEILILQTRAKQSLQEIPAIRATGNTKINNSQSLQPRISNHSLRNEKLYSTGHDKINAIRQALRFRKQPMTSDRVGL